MKSMLTAALALGALAVPAIAQESPKPGPEQARIGYYEGTWQYEGEAKESPMGPAGKVSMTETCQWFDGGFHLICRSEGTNPMGSVTAQGIMGYDPAEQNYTYYGFNSRGEAFMVRGSVAGDVWTWTGEMSLEGTPLRFRAITTHESPTAYSFKLEMSAGGGEWMVLEEGRATKQ